MPLGGTGSQKLKPGYFLPIFAAGKTDGMPKATLLPFVAVKCPDITVRTEGNEPLNVPVTLMTLVEEFFVKYEASVSFPYGAITTVIVALPDLLITDPCAQPTMTPFFTASWIGTVDVFEIFCGGLVGTVIVAVITNLPVYVPSKSLIAVAEFAMGVRRELKSTRNSEKYETLRAMATPPMEVSTCPSAPSIPYLRVSPYL